MSVAETSAEQILQGDRGVLVLKQTLGSEVIQALYGFFRLTETHEANNQIFKKSFSDLWAAVAAWIQIPECEGRLDFHLAGDQVFLNKVRIRPRIRIIEKLHFLTRFFRKRRILGFEIKRGLTEAELLEVFWKIARVKRGLDVQTLLKDLEQLQIADITIKTLMWQETQNSSAASVAANLYDQLYTFSDAWLSRFDEIEKLDRPPVDSLLDTFSTIDESDFLSLVCSRVSTEGRNPLAMRAVNTAFIIFGWARALGLPVGVILELAGAALVHPISTFRQQSESPEPAQLANWTKVMFSHFHRFLKLWPLTDLQVLALCEWVLPFGEKGVYELAGEKYYQHFFSRMLRIVVLFESMILEQNLSPEVALGKLLSSEAGCDQSLVRLFSNWIGIYPVGTFVKLTNGTMGQICSVSHDLMNLERPAVAVFNNPEGRWLPAPQILNLAEPGEEPELLDLGIEKGLGMAEAQIPEAQLALVSVAINLAVSR